MSGSAIVWNWSQEDRLAHADRFLGEIVTVAYSGLRHSNDLRTLTGRVVSVARCITGTAGGAAMIVLRTPLGSDYGLSLATVHSIARRDS